MRKKGLRIILAVIAAVVAMAAFVACRRGNENPVVATVDGAEVRADDLYFYMRHLEHMMANTYINIHGNHNFNWELGFRDGTTFARHMREEAVRFAAFQVIFMQEAERLGVAITDDMRAEVAQILDDFAEMVGGANALNEQLRFEGYRDRGMAEDQLVAQFLLDALSTYIADNPEHFAPFEEFLQPDLTGPYVARAEDILARIRAGEDFTELMHAYSEDPGLASCPYGYTFRPGTMVPEFEAATRELAIGEVSDLVFTDLGGGRGSGIHIIMRIPPIEEDITWEQQNGDDIFGAKHILISVPHSFTTQEERMTDAIFEGLQQRAAEATIEFLPELNQVPTQRPNL